MSLSKTFLSLAAITILSIGLLILFRSSDDQTDYYKEFDVSLTQEELEEYRALSVTYCSSCHVFSEPSELPKEIWIHQTLPAMGSKMGIFEYDGIQYPRDTREHVPENYYPDIPMVSQENWKKILTYFASEAPKELQQAEKNPPITTDPLFFTARTPDIRTDSPPTSTIAKFDPGNQQLYVSDIDGTNLLIINNQLEIENTLFLSSTLSNVHIPGDLSQPGNRELYLTYLGSLIPSDAPEGFIVKTEYDPNPTSRSGGEIETLIEHVARPVQTLTPDLNGDGFPDLLVHEFGQRRGGLFWIEGTSDGFSSERNSLIDVPGCIQSYPMDFTENGHTDVISLCTQKDQAIYLFENLGNGQFERQTLLTFPITAGSSSFEMVDFNNDGHLDILYTSGDNADFSITYKPYHGVYIYENDGMNQFTQTWFYPINGAYNAKARDFSGDGALDLAVISFFGDYANQPEETFLFFLNDGGSESPYSFSPYHHPAATNGRWITMDVADWTGNGFDDILLSNFSTGPDVSEDQARVEERFTSGPLFLLLENQTNR